MRVNEITDGETFTNLAPNGIWLRKCASTFGIEQSEGADVLHHRKWQNLQGL